jgi:hypothetical protein
MVKSNFEERNLKKPLLKSNSAQQFKTFRKLEPNPYIFDANNANHNL